MFLKIRMLDSDDELGAKKQITGPEWQSKRKHIIATWKNRDHTNEYLFC